MDLKIWIVELKIIGIFKSKNMYIFYCKCIKNLLNYVIVYRVLAVKSEYKDMWYYSFTQFSVPLVILGQKQ